MTRQRRHRSSARRKHDTRQARQCTEDIISRGESSGNVLPTMFRGFWILAAIVLAATTWLYILVRNAPDVKDSSALHFPSSITELQRLAALLKAYYATNPVYVTLLFCSAYIYKQAFIIPGSALLNVLGGALYGAARGFPLCCALTGAGASCCFALSKYIAKDAVQSLFPSKLAYLQTEVERNRHNLLYFLLFVRVFPMSPNWLVTLASPIIGVPYPMFLLTVVVGLMPYNFVCVQAGEMLATLTSLNSLFTVATLVKMSLLAFAMLGPSLFMRRRCLDANPNPNPNANAVER